MDTQQAPARRPESLAGSADEARPAGEEHAGYRLDWSYTETLDILEDAELMKALEKSDEDIKAGRVSAWTRAVPGAPPA